MISASTSLSSLPRPGAAALIVSAFTPQVTLRELFKMCGKAQTLAQRLLGSSSSTNGTEAQPLKKATSQTDWDQILLTLKSCDRLEKSEDPKTTHIQTIYNRVLERLGDSYSTTPKETLIQKAFERATEALNQYPDALKLVTELNKNALNDFECFYSLIEINSQLDLLGHAAVNKRFEQQDQVLKNLKEKQGSLSLLSLHEVNSLIQHFYSLSRCQSQKKAMETLLKSKITDWIPAEDEREACTTLKNALSKSNEDIQVPFSIFAKATKTAAQEEAKHLSLKGFEEVEKLASEMRSEDDLNALKKRLIQNYSIHNAFSYVFGYRLGLTIPPPTFSHNVLSLLRLSKPTPREPSAKEKERFQQKQKQYERAYSNILKKIDKVPEKDRLKEFEIAAKEEIARLRPCTNRLIYPFLSLSMRYQKILFAKLSEIAIQGVGTCLERRSKDNTGLIARLGIVINNDITGNKEQNIEEDINLIVAEVIDNHLKVKPLKACFKFLVGKPIFLIARKIDSLAQIVIPKTREFVRETVDSFTTNSSCIQRVLRVGRQVISLFSMGVDGPCNWAVKAVTKYQLRESNLAYNTYAKFFESLNEDQYLSATINNWVLKKLEEKEKTLTTESAPPCSTEGASGAPVQKKSALELGAYQDLVASFHKFFLPIQEEGSNGSLPFRYTWNKTVISKLFMDPQDLASKVDKLALRLSDKKVRTDVIYRILENLVDPEHLFLSEERKTEERESQEATKARLREKLQGPLIPDLIAHEASSIYAAPKANPTGKLLEFLEDRFATVQLDKGFEEPSLPSTKRVKSPISEKFSNSLEDFESKTLYQKREVLWEWQSDFDTFIAQLNAHLIAVKRSSNIHTKTLNRLMVELSPVLKSISKNIQALVLDPNNASVRSPLTVVEEINAIESILKKHNPTFNAILPDLYSSLGRLNPRSTTLSARALSGGTAKIDSYMQTSNGYVKAAASTAFTRVNDINLPEILKKLTATILADKGHALSKLMHG